MQNFPSPIGRKTDLKTACRLSVARTQYSLRAKKVHQTFRFFPGPRGQRDLFQGIQGVTGAGFDNPLGVFLGSYLIQHRQDPCQVVLVQLRPAVNLQEVLPATRRRRGSGRKPTGKDFLRRRMSLPVVFPVVETSPPDAQEIVSYLKRPAQATAEPRE